MRTELGLSQREAAIRSGVSFGTIQGVEAGRSPRNEVATLGKLAAAFHVDREWLLWGGPLDNEMGGGNRPDHDVVAPVTHEKPNPLATKMQITNRVIQLHPRRKDSKAQLFGMTLVG